MKKFLFVLSIICFNTCYVCAGNSIITNDIHVNDNTKYSKYSQYSCNIDNIQCSVDKIKILQTGRIFYEADCDCDKFQQSTYKNRAILDIKHDNYEYCELVDKTILH